MKSKQELLRGPYVDLTTDAGFKAVYCDRANKDVLIGLLNLFLPPDRQAADLEYLDREIDPVFTGNRGARLDLHCRSASGEEFIVEMQKRPFDCFFNRCVSYAGRVYADSLRTGGSYDILPVHIISILDARMEGRAFEDDGGRLRLDYVFRERETGHFAEDTIICTFALLYNLDGEDAAGRGTPLERYLRCFRNMDDTPDDPQVQRLRRAAHIASFGREKREQYERDMGIEFEERLANEYAIRKGVERGFEQGRTEGKAEGLAEGEAKGQSTLIKAMLANGMSAEQIAAATNLDINEVSRLME